MPFLPINKQDMKARGWSVCDIILISGDAYIDHPSFGVPIIARTLEAAGFRVGIIAQPDWHNDADF
ncbi:MAG TPA: YgiQ family radical SAM protein, partial [Candidatus Cloacimonas sp.]|nr:YgiQ family radical SAM protein [Candidatus Cloacimonas sp.]